MDRSPGFGSTPSSLGNFVFEIEKGRIAAQKDQGPDHIPDQEVRPCFSMATAPTSWSGIWSGPEKHTQQLHL